MKLLFTDEVNESQREEIKSVDISVHSAETEIFWLTSAF